MKKRPGGCHGRIDGVVRSPNSSTEHVVRFITNTSFFLSFFFESLSNLLLRLTAISNLEDFSKISKLNTTYQAAVGVGRMVCGDCALKTNAAASAKTDNFEEGDENHSKAKPEKPAAASSVVYEDSGHGHGYGAASIRGELQLRKNSRDDGRLGPVTNAFLHPQSHENFTGVFYFVTTLAWTLMIGSSVSSPM